MATPQDARHIANQQGDYVPQHQNNWMLEISGLPGQDKDLIVLSLMTYKLPVEKNNVITLEYGNEQRKVAGKAIFDDTPLKVRDYVDKKVREALREWRKLVYDQNTGFIGLPSSYKKTADVILMSTEASISRVCRLHGIWPSSLDAGTLDMASDQPVEIEATLTYDRAEWL